MLGSHNDPIGIDDRGRRVEEISRLEHELAETFSSLESTLEAVLTFESWMAKVATDLELTKARAAEMEKKEREKVTEVVEVKKGLEKSKVRISLLETEKASIGWARALIRSFDMLTCSITSLSRSVPLMPQRTSMGAD